MPVNKTTMKMIGVSFAVASLALWLANNNETYEELVGGGGWF